MLPKLHPAFKNFYFLTGVIPLVWFIFFDSNDLISQFKMRRKLNELELEAEYYGEKIKEVEKERASLMSNKEELERFARENYLMKKQSEDVYVIQKEE